MIAVRRLLLPLSALLLAGLATPSLAATPKGECVWNVLPASARAAALQNYRVNGLAAIGEISVDDALTLTMRKACNFTEADDYKAGEVLAGTLLIKASEMMLIERDKVAVGRMGQIWTALSPADKGRLTTFGLAILVNRDDGAAEAGAIVQRVTGELGLPTDSLNNDVFGYLIGRAVVAAREAGR